MASEPPNDPPDRTGEPELSEAQRAAAAKVLDALLAADARAQDPAAVSAAHAEAFGPEADRRDAKADLLEAPAAPPVAPSSPAREWAVAVVMMIVLSLVCAAFISYLRG